MRRLLKIASAALLYSVRLAWSRWRDQHSPGMPLDAPHIFQPEEPVFLSPIEEGFWRGTLGVVLLLRLDGCIEADLLAKSLQRLQHRHPKLRATIARGRDGKYRYQFDQVAPPIPFTITDHDDGEFPWREEARRLLRISPPPAGSLAAVTVLRSRSRGSSELILSVHHGIADGRSGIMLLDDLLTEYANAEAHLEGAARPALPVVSAARATVSGGWRSRLWLLRRFLRLHREGGRSRQTPLPEGHDIPPLSQWVHWVFSREDTLALIRRCRKEQVSFSGVLVAAVFCGLMDCLPAPEGFFKWYSPFDVREALEGPAGPVAARTLGAFAVFMRAHCKVPQQPAFWDLARRMHQDVQAFVQHGGPAFGYNMMGVAASRLFPPMQRMLERLRPSGGLRTTLFVTHYGVIAMGDTYGSLRPRECTLVFKGDEFTGPWLVMEGLVMGQRLNMGFVADGLEPAFWERLHVAVRRRLDAAAGLGKTAPSRAR